MAGKKTGKRLLTWVLVLVMALSLLPLNALADENGMPEHTNPSIVESEENCGAHLVKSATKDGNTYHIQLESWVTGKVEQTTGSAPLDIVLVLDQSGSMAENGKLSSLKKAVSDFVAAINEDAAAHKVDHRIAIVGFASNRTEGGSNYENGAWYNTGIFVNGTLKNYETYEGDWANVYLTSDSKPDDDYEYSAYLNDLSFFRTKIEYDAEEQEWGYRSGPRWDRKWNKVTPKTAADDDNSDHIQVQRRAKADYIGLKATDYQDALVKSSETSISTAIANLSASGATRASYGMEMANNVFKYNDLRDESSRVVVFFTDGEPGQDGYETDEAGRAIAQAHTTKNNPYNAKVFSVGMFDKDPSTKVKNFMNYVSSNYPDANASESSHFWEDWTITSGDPDADKYYMTVENDNLSDVFQQITGSILTSDVKADGETVLTDTLSKFFDFDGVTVENGTVTGGVTVKKVAYQGNDKWAENGKDITSSVDVGLNGKTVTVSGFDYSDEKNVVTDGTNGTNPSGYKLVVTFNVKPDTSYENWDASKEYDTNSGKATLAKVGEEPFATVASPKAPVDTYQVTYKPGDGTGNEYADQYYLNGATTKVKDNTTFNAPYGYEFYCWKDESGKTYQVNDPITFNKSDVTLTAQWKLIEAAKLSVEKTVTKVGETTVAAGNNTIPTAYPGDEIEWTITVTNSGNAAGDFTLKEALSNITVKDAAGNPVALSNNGWSGTVAANDSVNYTVTYTVKASDVTNNGLVNTVTMNGTSKNSDPVPTAQKYTVTGTIDNGGTVTESPQTVNHNGRSKAMTFTPANGYEIASVKVKTGNDMKTVTGFDKQSYTYAAQENVTADITVTVETTKRTDLSYTVNYLEKDTNKVLREAKTVGNPTLETVITSADEAITIDGYNYDSADKKTLTIGTGENVINIYYTKRNDLSYKVNYLEKDTNKVLHDQKVQNGMTFEATVTSATEVITIDGYNYDSVDKDTLTITTGENVINIYYTKRNDLSYTVNYLEKGTNKVLHDQKVQNGMTFEDVINSADEKIDIDGYNYDSVDKETLTIGTGENVINIYYTKRNDLSYTVHYYLKGTTQKVANDKTVGSQTLDTVVTEKAIQISGYRVDGSSEKSITIGTGTNEIIFYYTRIRHPSTPTKPTVEIEDDDALGLNTTDHFAYIVGYGNGEVRPQNNITRAEVATIFFRLLTDDVRDENLTKTNRYSDVAATSWYNTAVSTLSSMGIITGYPDGTFRPNAAITRAEFAAIAARFDNDGDKTAAKFSDIATHWAKDEISIAYNNGWITGYPDGTFGPQRDITRAETMTLVNRVLNRQPETEDDLLPNMTVWTDNANPKAWYYLAVQEATNSHYYEFKTNSQYEKWTELRETRDWTQLEK